MASKKFCLQRQNETSLAEEPSVTIPPQARSGNALASFEAQPCGLLVSGQSQSF